jgi:putative transposase
VKANQASHSIAMMCRVLGVTESGYHAWRVRPASRHATEDRELLERIHGIYDESRATYGAPRVHAELAAQGVHVGRKRVARLMRQAGLVGASRRRWCTTTVADGSPPAEDLVERDFTVDEPNQLWVADITYVPTWVGFLYLAIVLDAYSRRIVGWAMATHLRSELVVDALNMALGQRRPQV